VQAALDAGITWIDTAPFYGWGLAEEIVGDGVAGRRDEVRVLTKCGTVRGPDGSWAEDGSPAAVRADLQASLARLRTDHVDVLQLHDPDPATPIEDTMGALAALVDEGLVGAIGLSNHSAETMGHAMHVAPVSVVQHQWSLLHHESEAELAATWCELHSGRFLAWSPLASGFLTDAFDLDALEPGDLRRRLPWANVSLGAVKRAAADLGMSLERYALSWAARRSHPIVGARSPDEVGLLADIEPLRDDPPVS
jgi:aryl-alcohol dehydrogenase-like predicted oxidoreductase